ncbi:MAG: DUF1592 domain-containing protein, partial [Planctomycetaceae bacterium]|nr:DUF1592 domain-containing protein [Planctomycetaceae bacterium]
GEGEANPDREFDRLKGESETFFKERVSPFVTKYCIACHSSKRPTEAGVNFSPALKKPAHAAFSQQWKKGVARVKVHDMPPDYAEEQPTDEEREMFVEWQGKIKYLSEKDPGPFIIRRLTKTEYGNTLRDLFGVDPAIAGGLPDEVSGEGYLNSLSPLQLDQYLSIAEKVLDEISSAEGAPPTEMQVRLFGEPPSPEQDVREAARRVARSLARKAYRRPASEGEVATLLKVFDLGRENGLDYAGALQLMLKGILVSPQFLFITPSREITRAGESEPGVTIVPLDDYQLASRLSYLLWASMPDEELMRIADAGGLHESATLRVQVERLLRDPRSRALFDGFGAQWLGLGDLKEKAFDSDRFPQMTSDMRGAMYDEARLFFESIVRENLSVSNFVDSDFTFLNETLATIYGLEETVRGAEMRRVALTDENRGGVLGMPGILAATSLPNRTSPVKRGVWVLEQILGEHVPPPPPDVP